MLPPFVKALGPVKEWFSTWFVNTFMAKYQDLSDSASIEKVCFLQGCISCWLDPGGLSCPHKAVSFM